MIGLLWARQEARGYGDGARGGAIVGGTCALILDSSGGMIGTLQASAALDIYDASADRVWAVVVDDLDVPYVVRHAIRRDGSPGG